MNRHPAILVATVIGLAVSGAAHAAARRSVAIVCTGLSGSVWPSADAGKNHGLFAMSSPGRIIYLANFATKTVQYGEPLPLFHDSLQISLVEDAGGTPEQYRFQNMIPAGHGEGATKITVLIDVASGAYTRKEETLDASDKVGITTIVQGVCGGPKPKF